MNVMEKIRKYGMLMAEELPRAKKEILSMTLDQTQAAMKEYNALNYAELPNQIAAQRVNIRMEQE